MTHPATERPGVGSSVPLRWAAAGALALALHAGAVWLMIGDARPESLDGGGDAIVVELEPIEGEAAKAAEVQPAVPADETSEAAPAAAAAQGSQATKQLRAETTPPVETPPAPSPVQPRPPEPPSEVPPDVREPPLAPPLPDPSPQPPRPVAPPDQAAQTSAASAASTAAESAAPAMQKLSAVRVATWRGRLVPHLNRFRRFPPGIGSGTARVAFTLDAEGRVTVVSIATSSGNAALDDASRALIQRASPFPSPPRGVDGRALSFVVPIHYDVRRQ